MIHPVFIGIEGGVSCAETYRLFAEVVSAAGLEGEYLSVADCDPRAMGVRILPTVRVFGDGGDMLAEHQGSADTLDILALMACAYSRE